jgi:hypothetical protein
VTRFGKLGTTVAVTNNRRTLQRNATNVVPSSPILVTPLKEALSSSETSVLTRNTQHNIPGDGILHSQRRENLKSYEYFNVCVFSPEARKQNGRDGFNLRMVKL